MHGLSCVLLLSVSVLGSDGGAKTRTVEKRPIPVALRTSAKKDRDALQGVLLTSGSNDTRGSSGVRKHDFVSRVLMGADNAVTRCRGLYGQAVDTVGELYTQTSEWMKRQGISLKRVGMSALKYGGPVAHSIGKRLVSSPDPRAKAAGAVLLVAGVGAGAAGVYFSVVEDAAPAAQP